jgi:hypothetical protein
VTFGFIPGVDNLANMFMKALERIKCSEYAGILMATLADMKAKTLVQK